MEGMKACPDMGAILLECTDLPPFGSAIQEATDLPVFDFNPMMGIMAAALGEHRLY